ncbi:MAG: hypothetical protein HXY34_10115 [Candidatus Thorarchaeota archaeon]|nr:hypothetical protein [Candidatus Thorarchaeota archaeon]
MLVLIQMVGLTDLVSGSLLLITIGFVFGRRAGEKKVSLLRELDRLASAAKKGKPLDLPHVRTRREVIADIFRASMESAGLKVAEGTGSAMPTSYAPFAVFLRELHVDESMIEAMLSGISEAESESEVEDLVDAAADTADFGAIASRLEEAKRIAKEEWVRTRGTG